MNPNPSAVSINGTGKPRVIVTKADAFYTSGSSTTFTATTIEETSITDWTALGIRVGMKIQTNVTSGGIDYPSYAKVESLDDVNGIIAIDAWTNGTPTNGNVFEADGWIADLPFCQKLTQIMTPDVLVHSLYRSRKAAKFYGWEPSFILDYAKYVSPDTIIALRHQLAARLDDLLVLIPHVDQPEFQYNVFYSTPVQIARFGISPGYRDAVFTFKGSEPIGSWPIVEGYGSGYSRTYGSQL